MADEHERDAQRSQRSSEVTGTRQTPTSGIGRPILFSGLAVVAFAVVWVLFRLLVS